MDWEIILGNWEQYKGRARERWGQFTDNDLSVIVGKNVQLVGKLRERYG